MCLGASNVVCMCVYALVRSVYMCVYVSNKVCMCARACAVMTMPHAICICLSSVRLGVYARDRARAVVKKFVDSFICLP